MIPTQYPFDTQVLVELGPMQSITHEPNLPQLRRGRSVESPIPLNRKLKLSAIL